MQKVALVERVDPDKDRILTYFELGRTMVLSPEGCRSASGGLGVAGHSSLTHERTAFGFRMFSVPKRRRPPEAALEEIQHVTESR